MKPEKMTPAHKSPWFGELVCSNSLRSDELSNAVGLLKEEMRRLDSLIMRAADENRVPAGGALAVDREGFARSITRALEEHPNIEIIREEATEIPEGTVVVATGPLSSDAIAERIAEGPKRVPGRNDVVESYGAPNRTTRASANGRSHPMNWFGRAFISAAPPP